MRSEIRIGCGAGFWGDSAEGPKQLVESGEIDYLVLDYLAEITMSLLARARAKDPNAGYATDFPSVVAGLAPKLKAQGIKVVTNAGGVNPQACQLAIEEKLREKGIALKVAIVTGDDLLERAAEFADTREMFSGAAMPTKLWSMNAYLGAFPVAAALAGGADIVLTGRCVDSAVVLGALIHEFGWKADEFDKLSAGSLAGHVVECGAQATGGISTDWEAVAGDWDRMGFPIAVCRPDGSFIATKPANTGGRVVPETVAEQIVYEIGDPAAYLLPDVTCDWREVQLRQVGENRVEVTGAKGRAPTAHYKVSATWQDGFRTTGTMMIGGVDAVRKAEAVAAAILKRTRRLLAARGLADYTRTDVEVLGSEANWGANARRRDAREVILKLAVQHADKNALEIFGREFIPPATAMAQGITGFSGGRPSPTPLVRLFSCLVPKDRVPVQVDGVDWTAPVVGYGDGRAPAPAPVTETVLPGGPSRSVPLIALAYGRSGDKGDAGNIGVLARRPEFLPVLRAQLTAAAVKAYFAHFAQGAVERYELPGLGGFNFLLHEALGGGGMASLRYDPQGKMLAQILMDFPVTVPEDWVTRGWVKA
ncbi:acyclic terpene utilization AtuA family protein [Arenimonas sp.]|uniref:acyclic terpene utilization AtuA family protein n=1 Tax=Arenimonas sp. TaxID=1872635 RepID=UPI002E36E2BD|nr:acyclic terpene utilization AtuA family protein [Arenimonas sp.]HEX4853621.1 acyclic terpene utilization AtuA family protein [Arenimonas sp.]